MVARVYDRRKAKLTSNASVIRSVCKEITVHYSRENWCRKLLKGKRRKDKAISLLARQMRERNKICPTSSTVTDNIKNASSRGFFIMLLEVWGFRSARSITWGGGPKTESKPFEAANDENLRRGLLGECLSNETTFHGIQ